MGHFPLPDLDSEPWEPPMREEGREKVCACAAWVWGRRTRSPVCAAETWTLFLCLFTCQCHRRTAHEGQERPCSLQLSPLGKPGVCTSVHERWVTRVVAEVCNGSEEQAPCDVPTPRGKARVLVLHLLAAGESVWEAQPTQGRQVLSGRWQSGDRRRKLGEQKLARA